MAQDTITKVVHIETNYADAVRGIEEYQRALEDCKQAEQDAQEQYEKGEITLEQRNRTLIALTETEKEYKRGIRELSKEIQNNIKTEEENEGSLRSLRAELSNLTKEYDSLGREDRKTAKGLELQKKILEVTQELKEAETETQRFFRNVGDYPGQFEPLTKTLKDVTDQLVRMKLEGKENTDEYAALSAKAAELKDAVADVNEQIRIGASDTAQLNTALSAVSIASTGLALIGNTFDKNTEEGKKYAEVMQSLAKITAVINALSLVQNKLQKQGALQQAASKLQLAASVALKKLDAKVTAQQTGATIAQTVAQKALNAVMKANPVLLIVSGIAALVAILGVAKSAISSFVGSSKVQKKAIEDSEKALDAQRKAYEDNIAVMEQYGDNGSRILLTKIQQLTDLASKAVELSGAVYQQEYGDGSFFDILFANGDRVQEYLDKSNAALEEVEDAYRTAAQGVKVMVRQFNDMYEKSGEAANGIQKYVKKSLTDTEIAAQKANRELEDTVRLIRQLEAHGNITSGEAQRAEIVARQQAADRIAEAEKREREAAARRRQERQRAREQEERERQQALQRELQEQRAAVDARIALIVDEAERAEALENERYRRQIEDLRNRLATEKNLTEDARAAINEQIELAEQTHLAKMDQLSAAAVKRQIDNVQKEIELRLAAVTAGTEEEYNLKRAALTAQMTEDLQAVGLTEEQKLLIRAKYEKQAADLEKEYTNAAIQRTADALRLEYENRINEMAVNGENTLALEVEMKQRELETLQKLEGESDAAFKARQLAAQKEYVDAKKALADYEVEIETAKMESIATVTGALSDLMSEIGEEDEGFAEFAKMLALAEIAINTGKAIAAGTAQAMSVPYPANLVAIATTVATVISNIASAIKTVKGAKIPSADSYSTGGLVTGPGTGTSDSVRANLSNGESVNNALSTSLFAPLYSALNQLGGGVPIQTGNAANQIAGEEMLARAVARGVSALDLRIGVDEISRVQSRVSIVETLGDV